MHVWRGRVRIGIPYVDVVVVVVVEVDSFSHSTSDSRNAFFESFTMLFLYAYLLSHFALRQTELHLAIRLSQSITYYFIMQKSEH